MDRMTALTRMFIFTLINLLINVFLRVSKLVHITQRSYRDSNSILQEPASYKHPLIVNMHHSVTHATFQIISDRDQAE